MVMLAHLLHVLAQMDISMSKHLWFCIDAQFLCMTLLQALAQVDSYLRKMPWAVKEAVDDTAGAAQTIAKGELK